MDDAPITIRKYTDFWQSRPAHERLNTVEEMTQTAYELKGKTFCPPSMPMGLSTWLSAATR